MEQRGGTYPPGETLIGGLPLDLKDIATNQGGLAEVRGVSGQSFWVEVTEDSLWINDEYNEAHFYATVVTDPCPSIQFGIQTRDHATQPPYSDLYAGRLTDAAIAYFEEKHNLQGIVFEWHPNSDNYDIYFARKPWIKMELLDSGLSEEDAEREAQRNAALETWTSKRIAQRHGFTRVEVEERQEVLDEGMEPTLIVTGRFYKKDSLMPVANKPPETVFTYPILAEQKN